LIRVEHYGKIGKIKTGEVLMDSPVFVMKKVAVVGLKGGEWARAHWLSGWD